MISQQNIYCQNLPKKKGRGNLNTSLTIREFRKKSLEDLPLKKAPRTDGFPAEVYVTWILYNLKERGLFKVKLFQALEKRWKASPIHFTKAI